MENQQLPNIGTSRIEAFSDGVFAIVITLLVLELRIPILGEHPSESEAHQALTGLIPKFIGFAMSFVIIAIFWVNHHQFMHSLKKSNRPLLWFNMHLLFWVTFIPFPTAFIGEYYGLKTAVILFGGVLFMAAIAFYLLQHYAHFKGNLHRDLSDMTRRKLIRKSLIAPVLYAVSIVGGFINPIVSIVIFFLVPIIYFMPYDFFGSEIES